MSLEQALLTAQSHRPALKAAQQSLDRAKLSARALGSYSPTEFGIGQSSREGLGATDQDLYISQPLDIFGRNAANRRVGQANVQVAEAEYRGALLAVQADVLRSYFEASSAQRQSTVADELLILAESLYKAIVRRFEEGKVPEIQGIRATIELDRAKQTTSMRKAQLQAALKRLAGAIGSDEVPSVVDAQARLEPAPRSTDQRPDLLVLQAQVQVAEAESGVAARSRLPELELVGLRTPWREQPTNYGARLQMTWSILDHGRSRFEQSAAKKQAEAARNALADAKRKALADLSAIEIEIEAAKERLQSYETIQKATRSLLDKTQLGYAEGYGTLIDVMEANRSLREIEQELAEARQALNLAELARYEATGTLIEVKK